MSSDSFFHIQVHRDLGPNRHDEMLHRSLKCRTVDPRLHYGSAEQARKWLAIHRKYSPVSNDPATIRIYEQAFIHVSREWKPAGRSSLRETAASRGGGRKKGAHIISLGCGGGNKDVLLLQQLQKKHAVHYIPCDVSPGLVMEAAQRARTLLHRSLSCTPIVCDLEQAVDLANFFKKLVPASPRIFLFFGMLPNLEPRWAASCLCSLLRPGDFILLSANLAPGSDYERGIQKVLIQYNNPETCDWLLTFWDQLGVSRTAGQLYFQVNPSPGMSRLKRIEVMYRFKRSASVSVQQKKYLFKRGDVVRLFFSNRYTLPFLKKWMEQIHVSNFGIWINPKGDEAVVGGMVTTV